MSDSSRPSSVGYSTQASGYSRASSSSFVSDNSYSHQRFTAAPQFRGGSTSGSSSSALQQLEIPRRRSRRNPERPSLFSSFPKEYNTKTVECDGTYKSSTFKVHDVEVEIQKVLQGETVLYPRTIETTSNEKLREVVHTLKLYYEGRGAFIYVGSSLLLLFNKQFSNLQKCTEDIICDVCTFSLGSPALILTVVRNEGNGHLLKDYNALLAQEVHTNERKEVVGLRACNGVISVEDCKTTEHFKNEIKKMRKDEEGPQTILHEGILEETILSFLKMIAKCSGPEARVDEQQYLVGRMFLYFAELMQESHNVLVNSSSFDFSITLLSEMADRLVLAGKISLVVKGFDVITELHKLGERHANSVLLMYEQPSNSKDMLTGDICLTSAWTGDRKWIFRTGARKHSRMTSPLYVAQVKEGTVEARRTVFENMK